MLNPWTIICTAIAGAAIGGAAAGIAVGAETQSHAPGHALIAFPIAVALGATVALRAPRSAGAN